MKPLDTLLNKITMYRLVVYALIGYTAVGLLYALLGKLSFGPTAMIVSLSLLLGSAYAVDRGFARLFRVPTNTESCLITALIMFLIIQPANSVADGVALVIAGGLSSASKFLLARHGKHLFNPAALAAAFVSLMALQSTTWWIGNKSFWPITLIVGVAIVRKVRRFPLFLSFAVSSIVLQFIVFMLHHQPLGIGMKGALLASPLIFLGTVMLTEPATIPPRRREQIIFGLIVAVLYVMGWKIGPLYIYPEVALLLGNIYTYAVSPKFRVRLRLQEIQRVSDKVYNYVFRPDRRFKFLPGQYMEWTLAGVPYDSRGNRRTFTIASSPTEETVQLGLKYYLPASAYKATFKRMKIGDTIFASQLAGNFTLDSKSNAKLLFIAGGIGITPFRSMIKYLQDTSTHRDMTLLYVVSSLEELAYHRDFVAAQAVGLRYIPILTQGSTNIQGVVNKKLSPELLQQLVPDCADRTVYISGPNRMVDATKAYLRNLHVPRTSIKTDHFSGY